MSDRQEVTTPETASLRSQTARCGCKIFSFEGIEDRTITFKVVQGDKTTTQSFDRGVLSISVCLDCAAPQDHCTGATRPGDLLFVDRDHAPSDPHPRAVTLGPIPTKVAVSSIVPPEQETRKLPTPPSPLPSPPSNSTATRAPYVDQEPDPEKCGPPHAPSLTIWCLGPFRAYQNGDFIEEWSGLKGLSVLKYLATHRDTPVSKETLMDAFWPHARPQAARRNLHQAIYSLRETLRRRDANVKYIQFHNNRYALNPELRVWVDIHEFTTHIRDGQRLEAAGRLARALEKYGAAESIYHGNFLPEDIYQEWTSIPRENLRGAYLMIAERISRLHFEQGNYVAAVSVCKKILTIDPCDEASHRRLMSCYAAQGQRHLAIRQYGISKQRLLDELDVAPSEETSNLYREILSAK